MKQLYFKRRYSEEADGAFWPVREVPCELTGRVMTTFGGVITHHEVSHRDGKDDGYFLLERKTEFMLPTDLYWLEDGKP